MEKKSNYLKMIGNKVKNVFETNLYECPRCQIILNKKEITHHNIKCRKFNNEIEKDLKNNKKAIKDEYKSFIDKIYNTNIDDKNIKSLIKNFCLIFANKIELLENNIIKLNNRMKKLNENNKFYFKKINDSLDKINIQYLNEKEISKKKQTDNKLHIFHNKPILNKNEIDFNIFESKNTKKMQTPFILENREEIKDKNNNNNFYSTKENKRQFMSEKNILQISKETITQYNEKVIENKKNKEIIKRKKKKRE